MGKRQGFQEVVKDWKYHIKNWSTFTFVLGCIAFGIVLLSYFSPFLIVFVGIVSAILWFCFIFIGSVFTIGLMWLSEDIRVFNQEWINFNERVFNSGSQVAEFIHPLIPYLTYSSIAIFVIAWVFIIIGFANDKRRKKFYLIRTIFFGVMTVIFIILAILSLMVYYTN